MNSFPVGTNGNGAGNHHFPHRPVRVLLLNQYFPPDTSATANMVSMLACRLAQAAQVTVLAGRPSYQPLQRHPKYFRMVEEQGNLRVERVGSTAFNRRNMWGRLSNYISYLMLALPRAMAIRADLVISMTDPPLASVIGALTSKLRRCPFVYNVRDLHPEMAVVSEMIRPGVRAWIWERLHRWTLRQADLVIVLGEDMRRRVLDKGIDPARVCIVRDGTLLPESEPVSQHPVIDRIRSNYSFVALHAGNLGFAGAWESLVQAADLLNGENIGLVFVGEGAAKPLIQKMVNGSGRVRFLPYHPPDEVPYVLAAADVHIVTVRRGLQGLVTPSKLYPILAAGRSVLVVAPESSDAAQIVRRLNCGLVADPDKPAEIAGALRRLYQQPGRVVVMGRRAQRAAVEFDQRKFADQFVEAVLGTLR